ncbi:O-antigen ligase family protein [Canibacter zhoujuaniae]|uniref:O-antigen ligase family protein n=1 Tax=Canibacter zhoujuaniae TaxID=2708343 RepID=UPI0014233B5A|nr:O-antigen ligase family protein [Canibacter zhoujuaniae]
MSDTRTRIGISAFAVFVFLHQLGSNALRSIGGWPLYLGSAVVLIAVGVVLFVRLKPANFKWYRVPKPLFTFLLLALLSVTWSAYRFETVLGFLAQLATTVIAVILASILTWHEVLRTLGTALRYLLGLSLLFELFVEMVFGEPIFMGFVDVPDSGKVSKLLYWSRSLLFEGGPIQGVVANSALLGFLALLGLIVFAIQLRGGLVRPANGWFWVFVSLGVLALTRSATVWIALLVVSCTLLFALWARRAGVRRAPVYSVGGILLAGVIAFGIFGRAVWLPLLGKSPDLTGRLEIWSKVTALAAEHPWFGWGWVSYWTPWVEPFKSLDQKAGLPVMHAHNAWLDVWLQLGYVGLAVFTVLVLITLQRVWCRAIDQPRRGVGAPLPYATSALFPLLVFVALLTQSLAESRLLVEGGWVLLVLLAVKCRLDYELPSRFEEPVRVPWSQVPIAHKTTA